MQRALSAKSLRNALWRHADGKCQLCSIPLDQSFHADHIVPWRVRPVTNVHEMQALCPSCNLKKGGRVQ